MGLVKNLGIPKSEAQEIERKYHELYKVSDEWVASKVKEATQVGYITTAFGLRLRTPVLAKTILNNSKTPYEAQAESRTAGNALGQAYGMLNNRAGIEFQKLTLASKYALDIKPIAHIHDSQYFLVREDSATLAWLNTNLIKCMQWQELPEIQHPVVKLGGDLEIYFPSWKDKVVIPNNATESEIVRICREHSEKMCELS